MKATVTYKGGLVEICEFDIIQSYKDVIMLFITVNTVVEKVRMLKKEELENLQISEF